MVDFNMISSEKNGGKFKAQKDIAACFCERKLTAQAGV
jgi:hypothetical protein